MVGVFSDSVLGKYIKNFKFTGFSSLFFALVLSYLSFALFEMSEYLWFFITLYLSFLFYFLIFYSFLVFPKQENNNIFPHDVYVFNLSVIMALLSNILTLILMFSLLLNDSHTNDSGLFFSIAYMFWIFPLTGIVLLGGLLWFLKYFFQKNKKYFILTVSIFVFLPFIFL